MRIDPKLLRNCLGHFTTGVTVITCDGDEAPHGATANSFTAVSLDPALVLVSMDRRSKACQYLENAPFTVNVLRRSQDDVAMHFAGKPTLKDPQWERPTEALAPRLSGSLATIACTPWQSYDGGDHVLFLGEVQEFDLRGGEPLVFYLGKFRHLGPAFEDFPWMESGDCPELSWFPLAS